MLEMKYEHNLPVMPSFITGRGYELICEISKIVSNKKNTIKIAKSLTKFNDLEMEITESRNTELKNIINIYKDDTNIFFDLVAEKCDKNLHKFLNVKPNITKENSKEILECIKKIKKYSDSTFLDIFSRLHYSRLRKAILNNKNKKELYLVIQKENSAIYKRLETRRERETINNELRLAELERKKTLIESYRKQTKLHTQFSKVKVKNFKIIKNKDEADFWGNETHCCLKKGGAASNLLIPIETSPIAGEFVGKIKDSKVMIYFWDMIEINDGIPKKTLILDNLEASKKIKFNEFEKLINEINSSVIYNKIYIGFLRNDIEANLFEHYNIYNRQFSYLAGYKDISTGFAIADSSRLYLLRENNKNESFKLRKMNIADLHLTKYIEDYIYGYNNVYNKELDETDYIYQSKLDTPCYIIDNNETILGYIITRYRYYDEKGKEIVDLTKQDSYKERKLYIEDIVFSKNREVLKSIDMIIADFIDYCNNNNIKEVYCDTNVNSKNMKKRLINNGINVIDKVQNLTINPVMKIGVYKDEIKIENKLK